MQHSSMDN